MNLKFLQISRRLIKEVVNLKKRDEILIITNPERDVKEISFAIMEASLEKTDRVQLLVQPKKGSLDFAEDYVIRAIEQEPSVIISITSNRFGKDRFRIKDPISYRGKTYTHIFDYLLYGKKSIRGFWSPEITKDTFLRCVDIDYKRLRKTCKKLQRVLSNANEIRVTSNRGTDITFSAKGRKAFVDDGDFREPGKFGNIPCGEVFLSPVIGSANGRIVFDGSLSYSKGSLILKTPVTVEFKDGYVTKISGGKEARIFKKEILNGVKEPFRIIKDKRLAKEYSKNAKHLGEFGIGLNPKAKIVGNVLEDEKVIRTVHFAIGSNYDQDAKALIHYDGLVLNPNVKVNGKFIMKNGVLV